MSATPGGAPEYQRAKTACSEGHPYDLRDNDGRRCRACRRKTMAAASRRYRARRAAA